jgi:hypothetical protein
MEYYSAMKKNELLMGECQTHHAEWNEPVTKEDIVYDFIHFNSEKSEHM